MKLCLIVGTRPEIIKMSPLIRECEKKNLDYFVLHAGQHFSYNMDKVFFDELELPQPKYNLKVGEEYSRFQIRTMIKKISEVLLSEKPDYVLVLGDTNTVLAGSLAANRLGLKIVHLEGGLRSFDIVMAEEVNRMIADYLSELIFIPTHNAKSNLLKEGVSELKIAYSGNTIVDSIYQNLKIAQKKISIFKKLGLKERQYFLVTLHRSENVDIKERLESILNGFNLVYKRFKMPLVFPLHPRTKKMLDNFGLKIPKGVLVLDPISFLEFILLESKARLVLTDSGGLQEESCVMKIPCVTLRDNTERPETIEAGVNILCGTESSKIYEGVNAMLTRKIKWVNPFGDGKSAERIILTLIEYHNAKHKKIL